MHAHTHSPGHSKPSSPPSSFMAFGETSPCEDSGVYNVLENIQKPKHTHRVEGLKCDTVQTAGRIFLNDLQYIQLEPSKMSRM